MPHRGIVHPNYSLRAIAVQVPQMHPGLHLLGPCFRGQPQIPLPRSCSSSHTQRLVHAMEKHKCSPLHQVYHRGTRWFSPKMVCRTHRVAGIKLSWGKPALQHSLTPDHSQWIGWRNPPSIPSPLLSPYQPRLL